MRKKYKTVYKKGGHNRFIVTGRTSSPMTSAPSINRTARGRVLLLQGGKSNE